jgi:hypothetical protein
MKNKGQPIWLTRIHPNNTLSDSGENGYMENPPSKSSINSL